MKRARRNESPSKPGLSPPNSRREHYFFYEKKTGVSHFHLQASPDGQFPVEEAAGLLAMHCMVRGQSPTDYVVMVEAGSDALEGLAEKAWSLLQAGYSAPRSVKLTRREEEVLAAVIRSLANKEIAASLNLSERTVKFATREARGYGQASSYHNALRVGPIALAKHSEIQPSAELVSRTPVTRSMRSN